MRAEARSRSLLLTEYLRVTAVLNVETCAVTGNSSWLLLE